MFLRSGIIGIQISLVALIFTSCSPAIVSQLNWQSSTINADGQLKEWQAPLRFYDTKTKLNYVVSNDRENLYVCIRAADEQSQAKIMRAGMQIWIDTTGKKKNQVGISFPLSVRNRAEGNDDDESGEHKKGGRMNAERLRKKITDESNEIFLTGFKQPYNGLIARQNNYGINIGVDWDVNNIMIYEAVIPFATFYKPALDKRDSLKSFGFSIVVNGVNAPERKDGGNGGGGMRGGGGGMPGGMGGGMGGGRGGMGGGGMRGGGMGGMGGGMRGGGGAPSNPLYQTDKFWVKLKLASK